MIIFQDSGQLKPLIKSLFYFYITLLHELATCSYGLCVLKKHCLFYYYFLISFLAPIVSRYLQYLIKRISR